MFELKVLRLALGLALLVVAVDLSWAAWSFTQGWTTSGAQYVAAANINLGVALVLAAMSITVHRLFSRLITVSEVLQPLLGRSRAWVPGSR